MGRSKAIKVREDTLKILDDLRKKHPYLKTYDASIQFLIAKGCKK